MNKELVKENNRKNYLDPTKARSYVKKGKFQELRYCKCGTSFIANTAAQINCPICQKERKKEVRRNSYHKRAKEGHNYYEDNKDKILEKRNTEDYKVYMKFKRREWESNNKQKVYIRNLSKNEMLKLKFQIKKGNLPELKERLYPFGKECSYCKKPSENNSIDHFIPLAEGGSNDISNLIGCCKKCNSSKGKKNFFEWYSKQSFYNSDREQEIKYLMMI